MALAYESYLAGFSPRIEVKFQDASTTVTDSGSDGVVWAESNGSPYTTYQEGTASGFVYDDSVDTKYWAYTLGSSNSGWYTTDTTWFDGTSTTGSFVLVISSISFGDTLFCINGQSGGTTSNILRLDYLVSNRIKFQLYGSGGAGTDEITLDLGLINNAKGTNYPYIFVVTQDGTGVKIYCDGKEVYNTEATRTETAGDEGMWLHTLNGNVDGMTIGGYGSWSGGTLTSKGWPAQGRWWYLGYFDTAFTATQVQEITRRFIGGQETSSTTINARNKYRRYWSIQQGVTQEGMDKIRRVFIPNFTSTFNYHADLWKWGNIWAPMSDDYYWGTNIFLDSENINTAWYSVGMNSAGNVMFGNDITSSSSNFVAHYWNRGWKTATYDNPDGGTSGVQSGGWVCHPDGKLFMGQHNRTASVSYPDAPMVWEWDGSTKHFTAVTHSYLDQYGTRAYPGATYNSCAFSPDGSWAVTVGAFTSPANTISTASIRIWAITTTSTANDTWTFQTPGGLVQYYDVYFSTDSTYMFVCRSGSNCPVYVCTLSGGTWSSPSNTLINNGTDPTNWDSVSSQGAAIWCDGTDLYIGSRQSTASRTSYQNLFHLRWNGSYFAEQTDPPWPHASTSPQAGVIVNDIKATSDGKGLIVITNNAGDDNIPVILTYDRDTTTGALTLRDTPYDFLALADSPAGTIRTSEVGTWYGSIPYSISGVFDSFPTDVT